MPNTNTREYAIIAVKCEMEYFNYEDFEETSILVPILKDTWISLTDVEAKLICENSRAIAEKYNYRNILLVGKIDLPTINLIKEDVMQLIEESALAKEMARAKAAKANATRKEKAEETKLRKALKDFEKNKALIESLGGSI